MIRLAHGRPFGGLVLAVLLWVVLTPDLPVVQHVRRANFDAYQALMPRVRVSGPVVIVAIDDESLARHGQWPWSRIELARLVEQIAEAEPAAVGLDILMLEPDRLSPGHLARVIPGLDRDIAERLARLPTNEMILAGALARAPSVLGAAGVDDPSAGTNTSLHPGWAPVVVSGQDPLRYVRRFASAARSVLELEQAVRGRGLLNVEPEAGVVRRLPLVAAIGDAVAPAFPVELLRVAAGVPAIGVDAGADGVRAVQIGDVRIPTQADGTLWVHYSRHDPARFVSAWDVLAGTVPRERLARRLVVVGVIATGLSDVQATPVGQRMAGIEIHAQVLENIFDGSFLARPSWAPWIEAAILAVLGVLLILLVPRLGPRSSLAIFCVAVGAAWAVGVLLYHQVRLLVDVVSPTLALGVLFSVMLGVTLAEVDRHRRALRRELEREREAAAHLAGELEAAQRIQMGILPKPGDLPGLGRGFDLHAFLAPARVVGGDLYDFFQPRADRLFFLIGDVAGKGLRSSLFMAVSKSLYKSAALRLAPDVAKVMEEANTEISRENPELLFVTLFAGVLELDTGRLEYGSAGHEAPYLLRAGAAPGRLPAVAGPPLCVVDDFPYGAGLCQLQPGDTLCIMTDGIIEATNPGGELYGRARLEAVLSALDPCASAEQIVATLRANVDRFAAGAEPADDLTVLVLRWNGPAAPAAAT